MLAVGWSEDGCRCRLVDDDVWPLFSVRYFFFFAETAAICSFFSSCSCCFLAVNKESISSRPAPLMNLDLMETAAAFAAELPFFRFNNNLASLVDAPSVFFFVDRCEDVFFDILVELAGWLRILSGRRQNVVAKRSTRWRLDGWLRNCTKRRKKAHNADSRTDIGENWPFCQWYVVFILYPPRSQSRWCYDLFPLELLHNHGRESFTRWLQDKLAADPTYLSKSIFIHQASIRVAVRNTIIVCTPTLDLISTLYPLFFLSPWSPLFSLYYPTSTTPSSLLLFLQTFHSFIPVLQCSSQFRFSVQFFGHITWILSSSIQFTCVGSCIVVISSFALWRKRWLDCHISFHFGSWDVNEQAHPINDEVCPKRWQGIAMYFLASQYLGRLVLFQTWMESQYLILKTN